MKRLSLVRKTLRDVRGATIGFSITTFSIALLVLLLYPTYKDMFKGLKMPDSLSKIIGEGAPSGSFEQFIAQEFFLWVPIILIVFAIMGATATLAGEEGSGTLDLLMALPVKRTRVVLEKMVGLVIALSTAALASIPGFVIGSMAISLGRYIDPLTMAVLIMLVLTFLFLMVSLCASAALQTRGAAVAASVGAVVITYFLNFVGAMVAGMDILRYASPFYWSDASRVLVRGFDWMRTGVLALIAGIYLAAAIWSFNRRDLGAGGQEFSLRSLLTFRSRGFLQKAAPGDRVPPRPGWDSSNAGG